MLSIGELAKKANISRRTLHYYDEIGLLKPTKVDDKNYRYYDQNALLRLQEIRLLKSIGFTLRQIRQMVGQPVVRADEKMWITSLQEQIKIIQKEKENLERKQYYLQSTVHAIQVTGQVKANEIFELITSLEDREVENGVIVATFPDQLFTDEEMEILQQLPLLGSKDPRLVELIELIQQIRQNIHKPVSDTIVQGFAEALHVQIVRLFKGNINLVEKYWKLITPNENEAPTVYGFDYKIVSYINQMLEYYYMQQE
ncbi:MerR family transcriptional regulator [Thermoactinomyces sp. DSM 45892]|uniref:MerR family transcriptional regulator n=1 Tax=Thermoactinomyces sp. DSM 45892 TaxID=1882753 RepID=UPI0008945403|nr:MerR family transcriptional regulator [Thermoactinomyces sp. DSM 45892]SDX97636.1 DNA-binding transcriptional regulator, MerR family [Thermoactinomyces sp. DSM 45892]